MRDDRPWRVPARVAFAAATVIALSMGGAQLALAEEGYFADSTFTENAADAPEQNETLPNAGQLDYQRNSFAAFCHFGPNTFSGVEWGEDYGTKMEPAYYYMNQLRDFDADGYVKMIKEAGFSRLVVTAKHHDGFCIWQSEYTDYDMGACPDYKDGQGDILAELSVACSKYDVDMGLYLSPWDIHDESYGYDAGETPGTIGDSDDPDVNYNAYYIAQLKEILGNPKYGNKGKFVEVWMDGAQGTGADAQVYDFDGWASTIHDLQGEDCIIFQCKEHTGVRWIGNENGNAVSSATDELWSPVKLNEAGDDYDHNLQGGVSVGYADGDLWTVPEADARITSGWFWGKDKSTPKSLADLSTMYFNSIGHGATLLINIPPNTSGTVDPAIKTRVEEFASNIRMSFDENLATGAEAQAKSAFENDADYGPGKVLDGDKDTYWCAGSEDEQSLVIELGEKKTFDVVSIEEAIQNGQRIDRFTVSYRDEDGSWKEFGSGATIGAKRLVRSTEVSSDAIKIDLQTDDVFTGERALAQISEVGLYKASPAFEIPTPIPTGLSAIDNDEMTQTGSWTDEAITSCYEGTSQWTSNTSSTLSFTFTGTQFSIIGTADPGHGTMGVSVDGGEVKRIATNNVSSRNTSAVLYSSDVLEPGEHTVTISVISGAVGIDAAAYLPEGSTMLEFDTSALTMDEGSTAELTLRRVGDASEPLTVTVGFEPGTATQDHFDTTPQTVEFAAGETEKAVTVTTKRVTGGGQSGGSADGDRQFYVSLSLDDDNVIAGFNDLVTVTVSDVDQDLSEAIAAAEAIETDGYSASSVATLEAALTKAHDAYKNEEVSSADLRAIIAELEAAVEGLVAVNNYTEESPFLFPYTDEGTTLEFELGAISDVSNAADQNGKWPASILEDATTGTTLVNSLNDGDSLSVPFRATYAGTYHVKLHYSSGSPTNALAWSDDEGIVSSGNVTAGADDSAAAIHTVEFDLTVTKPGSSTLVFAPPAGKNAPRLDKLEVSYTGEIPVTEADPTENVASAKDATSSSDETADFTADKVTDGGKDGSSRWACVVDEKPAWVYVDLGSNYDVRTVKLFWETRKPTDYDIQIAPNGADPAREDAWTTVSERTQPAEKNETIVLDETHVARYVRVRVNDYVAQNPDAPGGPWNNISLYEIEVYGGEPEAPSVSYDALNEAIASAKALSEDAYTADSWSALQSALSAAEAALSSTSQTEVDAAAQALTAAIEALVPVTPSGDHYTTENPFAFPGTDGSAVLEFELGELHNDESNDAGWPMTVMVDSANGATLVDAVNLGDEVHVPFTATVPGVYRVTLSYESGSTANKLAWSDEAGIVEAGSVSAGADDEASALHTVDFEMTVTGAGSSTLVFGAADEGKAPRLDKLTITYDHAVAPEVDTTALEASIAAAEAADTEGKTAESVAALEEALDAAR
ncbi:alpha-L-fucosidase, partial [Olsenella sp. An290]|uniref:galactose-binding domain-containing protein n=1 Tax=Olsenella sp. An290 TaxID=1965625 RepID=UPI00194E6346